jgi:hypothetical protein
MVNKSHPLGVVPLDYKETHCTTLSGDLHVREFVHTCWQWERSWERAWV